MHPPVAAIVLAAGKGSRMPGERPKVAYEVAGRPMVYWVVRSLRDAGINRILLVVGYGAQEVKALFDHDDDGIEFVMQDEQLGTGHAVLCCRDALGGFEGDLVVLAGDGPLIRTSTLDELMATHRRTGAAGTLATSIIKDPTGYGRIVRDGDGRFEAIVEHRNASEQQRAIREVYPSYACFNGTSLMQSLSDLPPDSVSGEYYLTEVPSRLRDAGEIVEVVDAVPPEDVLSINTPEQLAEVDAILRARHQASVAETSP